MDPWSRASMMLWWREKKDNKCRGDWVVQAGKQKKIPVISIYPLYGNPETDQRSLAITNRIRESFGRIIVPKPGDDYFDYNSLRTQLPAR